MSKSVDLICARAGAEPVQLGLVLGSGLGHLAHAVDGVAIPHKDLDGFPHASVSGHNPNLHAAATDTPLHDGIYARYSGPSFETPAAISTITNMGAGLSDESISHDHTKAMAPIGAAKRERILRQFLRSHKTSRTSI